MEGRRVIIKAIIATLALSLFIYSAVIFIAERGSSDEIYPSSSLKEVKHLSDYGLAKLGYADSPVFIFEGEESGDTALIIGGTHPNELCGILSAYAICEGLELKKGRAIVIPVLNISGQSWSEGGYISRFSFGGRCFKVGNRLLSRLDSLPDPAIYVQYPSRISLSGAEIRDINRAYPGRRDGQLSERIAYSVSELIRAEGVDYTFDLHEASLTYPVNRTIITSEQALDGAMLASMLLAEQGYTIGVELSRESNSGYIHHEIGGKVYLIEVPTPFIDRATGPITEETIRGRDYFLPLLSERGYTGSSFTSDGIDISERITLHLKAIETILYVESANIDYSLDLESPELAFKGRRGRAISVR